MGNFKEDIARCEAFVFDVDGVMTDGGIIPTPDGDFIRRYNAKDGYALAYAIKMGYKVCIITGGRGKTLENRLRMLGINRYYTDCMDKITAMREYFADEGIDLEIVQFSDYVTPNNALANGDIDLNAFQHRIYLQNEIDNYGYAIQNIGNTFIIPLTLIVLTALFVIQKRGTAVVPEQLRKQLDLRGPNEGHVVLTRIAGAQHVIVVEPLPRPGSEV